MNRSRLRGPGFAVQGSEFGSGLRVQGSAARNGEPGTLQLGPENVEPGTPNRTPNPGTRNLEPIAMMEIR
jgi:hypothetical protein